MNHFNSPGISSSPFQAPLSMKFCILACYSFKNAELICNLLLVNHTFRSPGLFKRPKLKMVMAFLITAFFLMFRLVSLKKTIEMLKMPTSHVPRNPISGGLTSSIKNLKNQCLESFQILTLTVTALFFSGKTWILNLIAMIVRNHS